MSVKRDNPVAVEKAKKLWPVGPSESKSMISRWKSSGLALVDGLTAAFATRLTEKVLAGGGVEIGSKPRFFSTHLRSATMIRSCRLRIRARRV